MANNVLVNWVRKKRKTSFPDLPEVKKVNINSQMASVHWAPTLRFAACQIRNILLLWAAYSKLGK